MKGIRGKWHGALLAAALSLCLAQPATAATPAGSGTGSIAGTLRLAHGDGVGLTPKRAGSSTASWYELDNGASRTRVQGQGLDDLVGKQVRIHGQMKGAYFAADSGATTSAPSVLSSPKVAATGAKRVAVFLVNFSDNHGTPWTAGYIDQHLFNNPSGYSLPNYYSGLSGGQLTVTGQVFGWYTVAASQTSCDFNTYMTQAQTAATNSGVDLGPFTNYQIVMNNSYCNWAGLGYLPGTTTWVTLPYCAQATYINSSWCDQEWLFVSAHELGHNFGVHHASSYSCTDSNGVRVTLSSNCSAAEYGDPLDVMGSGSPHYMNSYHRAQLGWAAGQTRTLSTSGTYTIGPNLNYSSTFDRVARVSTTGGAYFYFDNKLGYDATFDNYAYQGFRLLLGAGYGNLQQSRLLDMAPDTANFYDAYLARFQTFVDPANPISISLVSTDGTTRNATVRLNLGAGADITPPSRPANLAVQQNVDGTRTLSWQPATDNVAVAAYEVLRGTTLRNATFLGRTTDTTFLDDQPTRLPYMIIAEDTSQNFSTIRTVTVPSIPANVHPTSVLSQSVSIGWSASTDDVSVSGYRVYRDGSQVATTGGTSFTDLTVASGNTYAYSVASYDGDGNISAQSAAISIATPSTDDPTPQGYVLDGHGVLHPYGSAPAVSNSGHYWPNWDIARGLAVRSDHASGYIVDGYGAVHAFGGAPFRRASSSWPGTDWANAIALNPCDATESSGYVLAADGRLVPFGSAPQVSNSGHYWRGRDFARDAALYCSNNAVAGYVLDAYGVLHPVGGATSISNSGHYWANWDIARAVVLGSNDRSGYVLDGWGGVHGFGGAAPVSSAGHYWRNWDIANDLELTSDSAGYVLDGWGGIHPFGGAPRVAATGPLPRQDIARSMG